MTMEVPPAAAPAGAAPPKTATPAQNATAQSFEAVFLGQMTQLMFQSTLKAMKSLSPMFQPETLYSYLLR